MQAINTLPEYRKKGLGTAVSARLLDTAHARGCHTAILFASPLGRPVYQKLGFKEIEDWDTYNKKLA